jgi:hypothetical protein
MAQKGSVGMEEGPVPEWPMLVPKGQGAISSNPGYRLSS